MVSLAPEEDVEELQEENDEPSEEKPRRGRSAPKAGVKTAPKPKTAKAEQRSNAGRTMKTDYYNHRSINDMPDTRMNYI